VTVGVEGLAGTIRKKKAVRAWILEGENVENEHSQGGNRKKDAGSR